MRSGRCAAAAIIALAVVAVGGESFAQPAAPVDARFEAGRALRAQHRDAEALELFRALFAETRQPRALAQLALAEAALARWVDAEAHLVEALALPDDEWMRANRGAGINLQAALETVRGHVGTLDVVCATPGAEVWIGGSRRAALPLAAPLRLPAGSLAFEVRAQGHLSIPRVVEVRPRELTRDSVDLVAVPTAAPVRAAPAPIAAPRPAPRAQPPAGGVPPLRIAAWVTLGGSALFLIGGSVAALVGGAAADRWNNDDRCLLGDASREQTCPGDRSTAESMQGLAVGSFIGGGVLAISSAVLFAASRGSRAERSPAARVTCGAGPGDIGVRCAVRF